LRNVTLDAGEASLLFEVISRRYERGSIILTSNKSFGEWAEVFSGDAVIATVELPRFCGQVSATLS
jgi:DNA replication protein DnaC